MSTSTAAPDLDEYDDEMFDDPDRDGRTYHPVEPRRPTGPPIEPPAPRRRRTAPDDDGDMFVSSPTSSSSAAAGVDGAAGPSHALVGVGAVVAIAVVGGLVIVHFFGGAVLVIGVAGIAVVTVAGIAAFASRRRERRNGRKERRREPRPRRMRTPRAGRGASRRAKMLGGTGAAGSTGRRRSGGKGLGLGLGKGGATRKASTGTAAAAGPKPGRKSRAAGPKASTARSSGLPKTGSKHRASAGGAGTGGPRRMFGRGATGGGSTSTRRGRNAAGGGNSTGRRWRRNANANGANTNKRHRRGNGGTGNNTNRRGNGGTGSTGKPTTRRARMAQIRANRAGRRTARRQTTWAARDQRKTARRETREARRVADRDYYRSVWWPRVGRRAWRIGATPYRAVVRPTARAAWNSQRSRRIRRRLKVWRRQLAVIARWIESGQGWAALGLALGTFFTTTLPNWVWAPRPEVEATAAPAEPVKPKVRVERPVGVPPTQAPTTTGTRSEPTTQPTGAERRRRMTSKPPAPSPVTATGGTAMHANLERVVEASQTFVGNFQPRSIPDLERYLRSQPEACKLTGGHYRTLAGQLAERFPGAVLVHGYYQDVANGFDGLSEKAAGVHEGYRNLHAADLARHEHPRVNEAYADIARRAHNGNLPTIGDGTTMHENHLCMLAVTRERIAGYWPVGATEDDAVADFMHFLASQGPAFEQLALHAQGFASHLVTDYPVDSAVYSYYQSIAAGYAHLADSAAELVGAYRTLNAHDVERREAPRNNEAWADYSNV